MEILCKKVLYNRFGYIEKGYIGFMEKKRIIKLLKILSQSQCPISGRGTLYEVRYYCKDTEE